MNHIYRSIWSRKSATFVAVSEHVKNGGGTSPSGGGAVQGARFAFKTLALSLLLGFSSSGYAQPTGGVVVAGSASIVSGNGSTTINQASQNAVLNWQSFSIGAGNSVNFVQPNSNAVALNRVLGSDPSSILGSLSANGKVFLVNPNGILFGQGAQVNVAGLVASTLNISDSDFMAGNYKFSGTGNGSVLNQGAINAADGYIALLGANVSNQGTISARLGTVALAAGNAITLDVAGDGLLNVAVNQGAVNALVQNGGLIQADGGQVLLSAQGAGQLLQTAVNNTGVIQAHTLENHNGTIKLLGDMQSGTVNVAGTLDASAPNGGNGGFIETSAAQVQVQDGARITTAAAAAQGTTGTWLIDPTDFTIAAGSGALTSSGIGADTLSSNLGSNNVRIETVASGSENGDIHVNSAVNWSANELTLSAHRDININATLNGSGTAKLALEYGQGALAAGNTADYHVNAAVNLAAGNNFSTKLGSNGSTLIYTVITSLGVAGDTSTTSLQGIDNNLAGRYVLGANIDASATSGWNGGAGFDPIGNPPVSPISKDHFTGTFDGLGHTISGLTINRPSRNYIGLFGWAEAGSAIRNVGLLGGSVTGDGNTGSLVGFNDGTVSRAFATSAVTGSHQVGGLVGNNGNKKGTIIQSFATGQVSGSGNSVGGLAGFNGNTISQSYATGAVINTGTAQGTGQSTGGLVGNNYFHKTQASGNISQSYATGAVTSNTASVGGLVGSNNGEVNTSYWATDTTGQNASAGGTAQTLAGLITAMPAGFNTAIWGNQGNQTTPYLLGNVGPVFVATGGATLYTPVLTLAQLQAIGSGTASLAGRYALFGDINASATSGWNSGAGFDPIGGTTAFTGIFDGLGHTISHLTINRPAASNVGLFGKTGNGSAIRNLGVLGGLVSGVQNVGGLVGYNDHGAITQVYTTGMVSGNNSVGGLVGYNNGMITRAYATGVVGGVSCISCGGLVGQHQAGGMISQSYATGAVNGQVHVGGLVGALSSSTVSQSYATGAVSGGTNVGGLAGYSDTGTISQSYATGAVTGTTAVGGLLGYMYPSTITQAYATGAVSGVSGVGGLVGSGYGGTISNSYWDTYSTGQAVSIGSSATTTSDPAKSSAANYAFKKSAYAGFDFTPGTGTWFMVDGSTRPFLQSEYSTTINNSHQLQLMAMNLGASYTLGSNIDASATARALNSGAANAAGMWSNAGFAPIGNINTGWFTGIFDGLGHTISGLAINRPGTSNVGLFGLMKGTISNIGLLGGSVAGDSFVGGLVGLNSGGTITRAYTTGTVSGSGEQIGGLVGNNSGTISQSYAAGVVSGPTRVGGLVGINNGSISQSYATGAVKGAGYAGGGLVGHNAGTINQSYATGAVSGTQYVGGLVGTSGGGSITSSYWDRGTSGQVTSSGGGTGKSTAEMQQASTFAGWDLATSGGSNAVWRIYEGHTTPLLRSFMTNLTLAGAPDVAVTYNGNVQSGASISAPSGVLGATASGTNAGFYNGYYSTQQGYDITGGNLTINAVVLNASGTRTYDGTTDVAAGIFTLSGLINNEDLLLTGGGAIGSKNVGTYNVNLGTLALGDGTSGLASNYTFAGGTQTATITKADLTLSTGDVSKTYDGGLTAAGAATVSSGTLFGSDAISGGTFAFTDKNAGSGKTVTVGGVTLSDGNGGGNYNLSYAANTASTITPAILTATASAIDKTYDGNTAAAATLHIVSGLVKGETVSATGAATFNSKDVAAANLVTVNSASLADGTGLASNYTLAAGQTATAMVTPKMLTVGDMVAMNKTYDGNTAVSLSGGTLNGLIGTEMLTFSVQDGTFADKNVGSAKAVTVTGIALGDGTGLASNYRIENPAGLSASITRRDAVAWVGGATGNWFDPANWADGAVPDLANVANVVIPVGVSVSFDGGNAVFSAQTGAVSVESVAGDGGMSMTGGSLNIAAGLQLENLDQSGGALRVTGNADVGRFSQSGGTLASGGNFTVANAFSQSGGAVDAGGNLSITQANGSVALGNLSANTLNVAALAGDITQMANTRIVSTGVSTLTAANGNVAIAASGNSFGTLIVGSANRERQQSAIAQAISTAREKAPNMDAASLAIGGSGADILAGLNVTVMSQGIRLPPGIAPNETNEKN